MVKRGVVGYNADRPEPIVIPGESMVCSAPPLSTSHASVRATMVPSRRATSSEPARQERGLTRVGLKSP